MKIFVEVRESQVTISDHEKELIEVLALLDKQPIEKRRFFKTLAALLITPDSFLLSLPPYRIASLISLFFTFIEKRETNIAVDCLPFVKKTTKLLLINLPDASFLSGSLEALEELQDFSFQIIARHTFVVKRSGTEIIHLGAASESGPKESFIILQQEEATEECLQKLITEIHRVLASVLNVQRDKTALEERLHDLEQTPVFSPWRSFLNWIRQDAFFLFAYCCFMIKTDSGKKLGIQELENTALGADFDFLFKSTAAKASLHILLPLCHRQEIVRESPVLVQRTQLRSPLYRPEPLIYMGFQEPLEGGKIKEHAFIGLLSESALAGMPADVPVLQHKIAQTLEQLRLLPGDYEYDKLVELLNLFPKIELFFMGEAQLQIIARSLLSFLHRSDTIKLLILASPSPTRTAALILIPQKFFESTSIDPLAAHLCRELSARLESSRILRGTRSTYIGLHLILIPQQEEVHIDIHRLEDTLTQIARPWGYKLRSLLEQTMGKEQGKALWSKYRKGFSPEYRALISPRIAVQDIKGLEQVLETGQEIIDLRDSPDDLPREYYHLQFYSLRESFLDELMPILENLGLRVIDQIQFVIDKENHPLFIKSFSVKVARDDARPLSSLRTHLLATLDALLRGKVDNDPLNELLVLTGLSWREIDIFRGYRNYYFQLGTPFVLSRFHQALSRHPQITLLLYRYFEARFRPDPRWSDPMQREEEGLLPIRLELVDAFKSITDVNEDRILRILFNLIDSTVRTNFYQRQAQKDYFLAFKISSLGVIEMPAPRPLYEIYVHSATMEGIHLRGGYIARGGIRWSNRPDDFRTEVLGLMQTQMMKNTLIVPVGAKGGFIVNRSFSTRQEGAELARQAYITFIQGLLDLTDNREGALIVRPPDIVAHDEEDPYLVVAADKGTASFSDTANEIAETYRFWLGNAFASGGAFGYHHKKLGITARGAWECVKRHFREQGQNIQTQPFTVAGIGSMDGDVFGNGMLLSRQIRLLAAFGPEHIFIDPNPDTGISYNERKRLFELPGSSWDDYNRDLISEGGGIYFRQAKDIPLSPQVRHWLGIRHRFMDGEGLIRLLLTAPVDLLWLGGIGTYIKASTERDTEAGDRANDSVRVDASQVQARVVGEGANLGWTQKGRIEFALAGGHINTDAVDNSAGVDLSDHEVNLKILFNHLAEKGSIASKEEQNNWLEKVKEEVCRQVLANNYSQSLCLSLDQQRCRRDIGPFMELADQLENAGWLDRLSASFPYRKEALARHGEGLTRPELAVLMSYSKMQLYQSLLEQPGFLSAAYLREFVARYFPQPINNFFTDQVYDHPLAKEITATILCNVIIDQAGCAFLTWVEEVNSPVITNLIATYLTFDKMLAGEELRTQIYALDNVIPASDQYVLLLRLEDILANFCRWTLNQGQQRVPNEATLSLLCHYLEQYEQHQENVLSGLEIEKQTFFEKTIALQEKGFTAELSRRTALLDRLVDFPILVDLAAASGKEFSRVVSIYELVSNYLGYPEIQKLLDSIAVRDPWERKAHRVVSERFKSYLASLTSDMLQASKHSIIDFLTARERQQRLLIYQKLQQELVADPPTNLLPFTVLCGELESLVRTY